VVVLDKISLLAVKSFATTYIFPNRTFFSSYGGCRISGTLFLLVAVFMIQATKVPAVFSSFFASKGS
jgi:hypothetical protein